MHNSMVSKGETQLGNAIVIGNVGHVVTMLDKPPPDFNINGLVQIPLRSGVGWRTPLLAALGNVKPSVPLSNKNEIVLKLLDARADPLVVDETGARPLELLVFSKFRVLRAADRL